MTTTTPIAMPAFPPGPVTPVWQQLYTLLVQRTAVTAQRHTMLSTMADLYGDLMSFTRLGRRFYVVAHPDLVQQVYVRDAPKVHKTPAMKEGLRSMLGNGLLTNDGEPWRQQRKRVQPAFHTRRIAAYADMMVADARRLFAPWQPGQTVAFHDAMMQLTLNIVGKALFQQDLLGEADALSRHITTMIAHASRRVGSPLVTPEWLPVPAMQRAAHARQVVRGKLQEVISARRASGDDTGDLLSMLLTPDADGHVMSDEMVMNEVITLFLAGHETTAVALSWAAYLLGQHPDALARLHAEADAVLGDRPATYDDLPQLTWASWVAKEAMRLYPPAWITSRHVEVAMTLGGYDVAPGSYVLVAPWVLHRDPRWWPNPTVFDPARFAHEDDIPKGAYIPFGGGPRVCVGNHFAMMEMTLILATLAQHATFTLAPGQTIRPAAGITLRPDPDVLLTMSARPRGA